MTVLGFFLQNRFITDGSQLPTDSHVPLNNWRLNTEEQRCGPEFKELGAPKIEQRDWCTKTRQPIGASLPEWGNQQKFVT